MTAWRTIATVALCALLLAAAGVLLCGGDELWPRHNSRMRDPLSAKPSPDLSPAEVVRIQLGALRKNDESGAGIAACFRFASPANQQQTGPVERFGRMIEQGPYSIMLHYQGVRFGPLRVEADAAQQIVVLADASGHPTAFLFILSLQHDPPHTGCWMVDAVLEVDVPPGLEPPVSRRTKF